MACKTAFTKPRGTHNGKADLLQISFCDHGPLGVCRLCGKEPQHDGPHEGEKMIDMEMIALGLGVVVGICLLLVTIGSIRLWRATR